MQLLTKEIFHESIMQAEKICILGHVNPDGDCAGSTLAIYNYIHRLRDGKGGEDFIVRTYLEELNDKFSFLNGSSEVSFDSGDGKVYDLAIICDCADSVRLGRFEKYYSRAAKSILIDHHFTNQGFGDYGIIIGEASSTCEVLYDLLDESLFDRQIAECIYTGIVHDTGVFRYTSTSRHTMEIAGKCIEQGIRFDRIIEDSFYSMSFNQKLVLGHILSGLKSRADGRIVYGYLSMKDRKAVIGNAHIDMDGMIDNIRDTTGALAAVYMYETVDGRIKASLRSNSDMIDVSRVCCANGGGGHKKAAGCFMSPDFEKNMDEIEADLVSQMECT